MMMMMMMIMIKNYLMFFFLIFKINFLYLVLMLLEQQIFTCDIVVINLIALLRALAFCILLITERKNRILTVRRFTLGIVTFSSSTSNPRTQHLRSP